ncbi:MAG: coniferyl aldehyde dehydrogenase [Rhizobiales bacterium]|nr:coniferyl aldehyde dehydrogenase [Hyphomicrobiales bacterium]NRB13631.1 coniferyl aldehyde dehydrogenase [Hyphomicrobiales bacterium]
MDVFKIQQAAFAASLPPSFAARMGILNKLYVVFKAAEADMITAVSADFGHRSAFETRMTETSFILADIKHTRKKLKRWMATKRRPVALHFWPGKAYVEYQPKGVVGIISPWNYPLHLAFVPLIAAIAAGNRVMLKPSEFTPHTNKVITKILAEVFDAEQVAVIEGDAEIAAAFSALPFDHLFFTGSGAVGKLVMQAAAKNLTPITLELGGKSPAIIGKNYNIAKAAERIMVGKLLNAGQTCIAPDYVLVPEAKRTELAQALIAAGERLYPDIMHGGDYTSIINRQQYERLHGLLHDAVERGALLYKLFEADDDGRKMMPAVLDDVEPDMKVMQEEIFGPILPIIGYEKLDDAISFVNSGDKPLAAYYFSHDDEDELPRLSQNILCGGVTINDTIYHFAQNELPLGGIGASGMGHYHGHDGFKTFSHAKGVFKQARFNGFGLLKPPYSKLAKAIVDWVS